MSVQQVSGTLALEAAEDHGVTKLSTAVAEYYSASTAATEVLYLRNLLENMGFAQPALTPMYEDNTACIEWGNHIIGGRERAKHSDNLTSGSTPPTK